MADPQGGDEKLARLRERWEQEGDSRVFLQLAEEYRKQGLVGEAAEVLQRGLDKHPTHVSAWVALGRCRLELGAAGEAKAAFEKVLSFDPTQLVASKLMVEAELARGNGQEAASHLEHYLLLNPQDRDVEDLRVRVEALLPPGEPSGILALPEELRGNGSIVFPWIGEGGYWQRVLDTWPPQPRPQGLEGAKTDGEVLFPLDASGVVSGDPFSWVALERIVAEAVTETFPLLEPEPADEEEIETEPLAGDEPEVVEEPVSVAELPVADEPEPLVEEPEEPEEAEEPGDSAPATATLGQLYLRQGHLQDATQIFEQVLTRDPGNAIALEGLDEILARREEPLTAVDLLEGEDLAGLGLSARKILMLKRYQERLREREGGHVS